MIVTQVAAKIVYSEANHRQDEQSGAKEKVPSSHCIS